MNSSGAIETKVGAGSFAGAVTGLLTYVLVTFVPALHAGLPAELSTLLPILVGWLCHTATAWLAPHTTRPDQLTGQQAAVTANVAALVNDVHQLLAAFRPAAAKPPAAAPVQANPGSSVAADTGAMTVVTPAAAAPVATDQ